MRTVVLACALLVVGCGDDTTSGFDMSMPDLSVGVDMSLSGVTCGTMTCGTGKDCCVVVSSTGTNTYSCVDSAAGCAGGAVLMCDGPEDCPASSQYCCGMITLNGSANPDGGTISFGGGNAGCAASCDFSTNYPTTPTHVTTRLCHFDSDCTGLSTAFGNLDKCCSSAQAPGLHFCATTLFGITCP